MRQQVVVQRRPRRVVHRVVRPRARRLAQEPQALARPPLRITAANRPCLLLQHVQHRVHRAHVLRVARERLHAHLLRLSSPHFVPRHPLATAQEAETGGAVARHQLIARDVDAPEGPHARQRGVLGVRLRHDSHHALGTAQHLVEGVERVDAQNVHRVVHEDALQRVDRVVDAVAAEGGQHVQVEVLILCVFLLCSSLQTKEQTIRVLGKRVLDAVVIHALIPQSREIGRNGANHVSHHEVGILLQKLRASHKRSRDYGIEGDKGMVMIHQHLLINCR